MEPSYKRDGDHTYLVLQSLEPVSGSEYPIRVLLENNISGLLTCSMRMINGTAFFYYEITSRQSLVRAFDGEKMGRADIERLLEGIRKGVEQAKNYLLDRKDLLLAPEYIYLSPDRREVFLCVLPFSEGTVAQGFSALAEYILKNLDHSDGEAVLWGYEIFSMTERENYSLDEILRSSCPKREEKREAYVPEKPELHLREEEKKQTCSDISDDTRISRQTNRLLLTGAVGGGSILGIGTILWMLGLGWTQVGGILFLMLGFFGILLKQMWEERQGEQKRKNGGEKKRYFPIKAPKEVKLAIWQEEEVLPEQPGENIGETKVLSFGDICPKEAALVRADGEKEPFVLTERHHIIGKLKGRADLILDEPEVSRIHAKIEQEGDGYYLMDLNSRNGTFVNGIRLEAEESRKLQDQDRIRFGNAVYFFREQLAQEGEIHYNETIT